MSSTRLNSKSGSLPGTMKALVYDRYGTPDVLRVEEVKLPKLKSHEVLIAVEAASVNSWDWDLMRGKPFMNRIGAFRTPRYRTLGADIAGRIVAAGESVTLFQPGDKVYGDVSGCGWGGFAEYCCADAEALAVIPAGLTMDQAAALPQAAVLALQGLRDQGKLAPGEHVLFNGAGGGVGTFGIQYAKALGAEVTGVDKAEKLSVLRSLGADHVVDYESEDFTTSGSRYDLILDVVGVRSFLAIKRILKPDGRYVMVGGATSRLLQTLALAPLTAWLEKKKASLLIHKPKAEDLLTWNALVDAGQVRPIIDRQYTLSEAAEAFRYFGEGRAVGKVVIRIDANQF